MKGRLGIVVLTLAGLAALARVLTLQLRAVATDKTIIRMVHWQLEPGIREALDEIGHEYAKRHPDFQLEQILISERRYPAWVMTRLIGGTAPELIEVGINPANLNWIMQRYYQPLSDEVLMPNPYNAGTALAGVPWKDTFYDDMISGYNAELLEYYLVPSAAFQVRLFYNQRRFREITGLTEPPADFRQFLAACETIKVYARQHHEMLVPIAGAGKYNANFMFERFAQSVNSTLMATVDVNRDNTASAEESGIALVGGAVSFQDPRIRAMFRGRDYYIPMFQPAFFPADRMDAAFLFFQQRALLIASGSWDAASYAQQADFPIAVVDFPVPTKTDPEFGAFVEGPAVETLSGAFAFAVNRMAPHPDVALDFLKFLTSQPINDRLNRRIRWVPMIRGNLPDPSIAGFWPHLDGVRNGIELRVGAYNSLALDEQLNLYSTGRIDYEGFLKGFLPTFVANCDRYFLLDRPRNAQIAFNTDQCSLEFERAETRAGETAGAGMTMAVLEATLARRHSFLEMQQRYREARAHTTLPTP